jgi:hypothetical protein
MRQSTLNANFRSAQLAGFDCFVGHLLGAEEIRVMLTRSAAEGAELAADEADVGEIDVAIDDICDEVAGEFGAEFVGGHEQTEQIIAITVREQQALFEGKKTPILRGQRDFQCATKGWGQAWRDIGPVERREAFQFRVGNDSLQGSLPSGTGQEPPDEEDDGSFHGPAGTGIPE